MREPKKIAVVGSSHVSWWQHAIATQQIPEPFDEITFIGLGAMPIWGDFIRHGIDKVADHVDQIFLLLGDFRHGNRVLTSEKFLATGDTSGSFLNIAKELISDDNDKILLGLIVDYLQALQARFGAKLRILFWSLTFREFQSIEHGRYGGRENYRHPVWNLDDLVGQFKDVAIDTKALTYLPIHSFYLDASGHPTVKGHAFLYRLFTGQNALEAYESVFRDFSRCSPFLYPPERLNYRVCITGDAIAYKSLVKAVRHNYFKLPDHWQIAEPDTLKKSAGQYDHITYLSGLCFQDETSAQISAKISEEQRKLQTLADTGKLSLIFWDQWARELVSQRSEYQGQFLPICAEAYANPLENQFTRYGIKHLSALAFEDANGLVEFGNSFQPSGKGYAALFHLMVSEKLFGTAMARYKELIKHCLQQPRATLPNTTAESVKSRPERLLGHFDGINPLGDLYGWAVDPFDPDYQVPVYILVGNQPIMTLVANQPYQGQALPERGNANIGFFSDPMALSILRNLHVGVGVRVCFDKEGKFELPNSPLKLDKDTLATLSIAALRPWQTGFHTPKQAGKEGTSLFIAKKIAVKDDPAIFPRTELIVENAVVESVKRLPPFFKAVIRARVIGGIYREDGVLEQAALGTSALGLFQLADKTLTTQPARHIDSVCLYGGMILSHYGHFIIEGLARFQAFAQYPNAPIVFTLPYPDINTAQDLPSFIKAIFGLLGIPLERIVLIKETTAIKQLVVPKVGMRWFDYLDTVHYQAMAQQVKATLGSDYPTVKNTHVYLSRSKLSTNHDGNIICGEAEFENYLRGQGFLVIHPESLSVKEQVQVFCAARRMVGFVGSGFHTLLLCADVPEKIFYLHRKKDAVNPQFPLIDKALGIQGEYIDKIIKNSARVSWVDFKSISLLLQAEGLVQQTFDPKPHNFEKEYRLLSDWLDLKKKNQNLSTQDQEKLAIIVNQCLNTAVVEEARSFLANHLPNRSLASDRIYKSPPLGEFKQTTLKSHRILSGDKA